MRMSCRGFIIYKTFVLKDHIRNRYKKAKTATKRQGRVYHGKRYFKLETIIQADAFTEWCNSFPSHQLETHYGESTNQLEANNK